MVSAFELPSTYDLTLIYTRVFTEQADIKIWGAGTDWSTSKWTVFVYYSTSGSNDRGKILKVQMDDLTKDVFTYYFMPEINPIDNKPWINIVRNFMY